MPAGPRRFCAGLLIGLGCGLLALVLVYLQGAEVFKSDSGYAASVLPYAVAFIGTVPIVNGFASPARVLYERKMDFRRVSQVKLAIAAVNVFFTVMLALYMRNIWALVLGNLFGALVDVYLSYRLFTGPAMRLNWEWAHFRVIIARGKWIMSQGMLAAVINVADRFVLGFVMSASNFGFYYIARQIVDMIQGFLIALHGQMGLQVFTELQRGNDRQAFRRRYYRYRILFDSLAMFGAGMLVTFAPRLIALIYDPRYQDVADIIQILAFGLIFIGPGLLREAFSAKRRFRDMTILILVRAITIWVGMIITVFGYRILHRRAGGDCPASRPRKSACC